jgi:general stress protein 26
MSQITDEAISYIEKSPYALLITVSEDKRPSSRYIGPLVTDGLDIYFVTRTDSHKTDHIKTNPFVSLFFQSPDQSKKTFRCVTINGKAEYLPQGDEFNNVWEKLGKVSPGYKEYVSKEGFKVWSIYKVKGSTLELIDLSKSTRAILEKL